MIAKLKNSHWFTIVSILLKSILDRFVAAIALPIFSPLMLIVASAIHICMGSPVLFTQQLSGKDCYLFIYYKFRTMSDKRGSDEKLLPDAECLTSLGKFLSQMSLDELPQLWSILKRHMPFVGHRPLEIVFCLLGQFIFAMTGLVKLHEQLYPEAELEPIKGQLCEF